MIRFGEKSVLEGNQFLRKILFPKKILYSQQIGYLADVFTETCSDHDTESGHELPTSQITNKLPRETV